MSVSNKVIFDTNAAIEWINGPTSLDYLFGDECSEFFITVTVLGELYFGAEKSARKRENLARIEQFLGVVTLLEIDRETAREYGRVEAGLRARGCAIPHNDMWIAASSILHRMSLLTRDGHFDNVIGLTTIRF